MTAVEPHPEWGFATRAIHAGQAPDPSTGAVVVPVTLSTTFVHDRVGVHRGYEYSRSGNPTRSALERALGALEGAAHAFCFASGLAAEDAVLRLLAPGDTVLIGTDAYGGTYRLIDRVHGRAGVAHEVRDLTDPAVLAAHWPAGVKMVWVESPTNPMLSCAPIAALVEIAHAHDAVVVVDNTFATPYLQQPLTLGADLVIHSSTKYLGGHSDVVGGAVLTNRPELAKRIGFLQNATGAVPSPFDCYLVLRGLKTLALRMERHCTNATQLAHQLQSHPAVAVVHYPGLASHPTHHIATRQMRGFGGMLSVRLEGGAPAAIALCERTRLFALAESLGAVESLIEYPAHMTHASVAGSPLEVPDDLVRLSVGVEDVEDLLADLYQALDTL